MTSLLVLVAESNHFPAAGVVAVSATKHFLLSLPLSLPSLQGMLIKYQLAWLGLR